MEQCITWSLSSWNLAISIIYNTKRLVLVTAWNNRQVAASTFNKVKVQRAKFLTIQGFLLYTSLLAFRTHLFVCYLQNFIHQHKANKWMSQKHFYCAIKLCQNFLSYMYFFHDWLNIITKSKIKHMVAFSFTAQFCQKSLQFLHMHQQSFKLLDKLTNLKPDNNKPMSCVADFMSYVLLSQPGLVWSVNQHAASYKIGHLIVQVTIQVPS